MGDFNQRVEGALWELEPTLGGVEDGHFAHESGETGGGGFARGRGDERMGRKEEEEEEGVMLNDSH